MSYFELVALVVRDYDPAVDFLAASSQIVLVPVSGPRVVMERTPDPLNTRRIYLLCGISESVCNCGPPILAQELDLGSLPKNLGTAASKSCVLLAI